jgi:uncharacterized protein (TIGR02452 family)
MGRTEKSQGLAPPAVRRDIRAKQARQIINRTVPAILASNARARRGADNSELIANPEPVLATGGRTDGKSKSKDGTSGEDTGYVKRKGQGRRKAKDVGRDGDGDGDEGKGKGKGKSMKRNGSLDEDLSSLTLKPTTPPKTERSIRVIIADTLTAAQTLSSTPSPKSSRKQPNVCILNMASPLRPGGGVLTGATSQEEYLCSRTTLLPSLKEAFYRLPEFGGIFTPDVLVFRSSLPLGDSAGELPVSKRWFVDVVSAGMLRFPELEGKEEEVKRLGKKDRDAVEGKIRAVMRICERKGVRKLVLGAWGCGAYGNPVQDIVEAFRKVLGGEGLRKGGKKNRREDTETWPTLEEVIFAIGNHKMATDFSQAFGGVEVEAGPGTSLSDDEGEDEEDKEAQELRTKIQEMEAQLESGSVWNPDLRARMGSILDGLKAQLRDSEGTPDTRTQDGEHEDGEEDDEGADESYEEGDGSDDEENGDVRSYGSSDMGCFHPNPHDW